MYKFLKSRYCSGAVGMLSEMTGSLRATIVKRQYYPRDRHHTFHTVHHEQSIVSEVNMWCQMNSCLSGTIGQRNITSLVQSTTIFPVMTLCRNELATTPRPDDSPHEHWTLHVNSEQGTWTVRRNSHDIIGSVPTPSFFRIFRWTELYCISQCTDIVGCINCATVTLLNVDISISVWHRPFTIAIVT